MELIEKKCRKCGNIRKFLAGAERDIYSICGQCWDWKKDALGNLAEKL